MKRYGGGFKLSGLLFAAGLFVACAGNGSAGPSAGQVRVQVAKIGQIPGAGEAGYVVLLKEPTGDRQLQLLIGGEEGRAITLELHGLKPPRPLTQFLLSNVISSTGNKVDRVAITALRNEIYYATIYLDQGRYQIDSRPSDAIALALSSGAPIYVASNLLAPAPAAVASGASPAPPSEATGFGLTVQELTPELASYFGTPIGGGLLVADVSGVAGDAGVRRGDILETVGTTQVRTLADYRRCIVESHGDSSVTLTFDRLGVKHAITVKLPGTAGRQQTQTSR